MQARALPPKHLECAARLVCDDGMDAEGDHLVQGRVLVYGPNEERNLALSRLSDHAIITDQR